MTDKQLLKLLHDKQVDIKLLSANYIMSARDYNGVYKSKHLRTNKNILKEAEFRELKGWAK